MPPLPMDQITLRHIEFANEYLACGNAARAYQKIFKTNMDNAYGAGPKLLNHPTVRAIVDEAKLNAHRKLEITAERIIHELACIAFYDIEDIYDDQGNMKPLSEIPEDARRAIVSIDPAGEFAKKAKIEGKRGALQLLGQTMALFIEKKLVDEKSEQTITMNRADLEERIENITGEGRVDPFA